MVKDKFGVAPLPGVDRSRAPRASVATTSAISVYSKHKATALDFLKFLESDGVAEVLRRPRARSRRSSERSTPTRR